MAGSGRRRLKFRITKTTKSGVMVSCAELNLKGEKSRTKVDFRSPEDKERSRERLLHNFQILVPPPGVSLILHEVILVKPKI